jgi:hypothetical protein
MTLVKRPTWNGQREILGVIPQVSREAGVQRICQRMREGARTGKSKGSQA